MKVSDWCKIHILSVFVIKEDSNHWRLWTLHHNIIYHVISTYYGEAYIRKWKIIFSYVSVHMDIFLCAIISLMKAWYWMAFACPTSELGYILPPGKKPLPEPNLTQNSVAKWGHWAAVSQVTFFPLLSHPGIPGVTLCFSTGSCAAAVTAAVGCRFLFMR